MRHFIVLGFKTTASSEQGVQVHLGQDRGEAIDVLNEPEDRFARKQLFELAVPHITRHYQKKAPRAAKKTKAKADVSAD